MQSLILLLLRTENCFLSEIKDINVELNSTPIENWDFLMKDINAELNPTPIEELFFLINGINAELNPTPLKNWDFFLKWKILMQSSILLQ